MYLLESGTRYTSVTVIMHRKGVGLGASQDATCFKVAGTFAGEPTACSDALPALITARLQPLARVTA
eukprot:2222811-Prymnesium_polylepis.1